jgi:hypothetical protein
MNILKQKLPRQQKIITTIYITQDIRDLVEMILAQQPPQVGRKPVSFSEWVEGAMREKVERAQQAASDERGAG